MGPVERKRGRLSVRLCAITILAFATGGAARAQDLGVMGKVWPIAEQDLLVQMAQAAAHVDWRAIQRRMLASARYRLRHMPDAGIPEARHTGTRYVDPSIVLRQDIEVPVRQADGRYTWRVLYLKGTKVNPLQTGIRPVTRMLFFDPRDPGQWAFARAAKRAFPDRLILVATSGDLPQLAKAIGQPVFYSVPKLAGRLGVAGVPALVGVGEGAHEFDLAVTTFGPKAVADLAHVHGRLREAWDGIADREGGRHGR